MNRISASVVPYRQLRNFTERVFLAMGLPGDDAVSAAEALLAADLRGIDSHGIARLPGYVRLWKAGRINPVPDIKIVHETPSTATVDGDSGFGLVVAPKAMQTAISKAAQCGSGWVSVRHSTHFGIAGYHAMLPLACDMIGVAMTNASPLVTPTFSRERMLGTNPIAIAIPAGKEPPFVADFATTTVANGKLEILQREGREAPPGWVQDKEGKPSTRSDELKHGGALLPLGGDPIHGSHKGYCLGAVVDILSAVLSGANYGPWVPPFVSYLPLPGETPGRGIGHFLGAIRIDGFRPADEYKQYMDQWIGRFRNAAPADGCDKVLIPGDPEREMQARREKGGIPVPGTVREDLRKLESEFSLKI